MTRKHAILLAAITLFAIALRWTHLGSQSLWFDEGYTAWAINHPASQIIAYIRADTAPPLYYLLLHFWTTLLHSDSEFALRSLSALAGTVQVLLVFYITLKLLNHPPTALIAALLFTLSFLQYWYSREARAYELMSLLASLSFLALLELLKTGHTRHLILLSLLLATALYTHNMMLTLPPALAVAGLLLPSPLSRTSRLRRALLVTGIVSVLYIPWLLTLAHQIHRIQSNFWVQRPQLDSFSTDIAGLCGVRHIWTWDRFIPFHPNVEAFVPAAAVTILLIALILIPLRLRGAPFRIAISLAAFAFLPPLLTAAWSLISTPVFMMKLFVFSTVPICILIAAPLAWARRWLSIPWITFALALYAANNFAFIHENQNEDWRSAAHYVANLPPVPQRLILFVAYEGQLPFDYYYSPHPGDTETGLPHGFFDTTPPQTMQRVLTPADLSPLSHLLARQHFDDIVLVLAHQSWSDPSNLTLQYLTTHFPSSHETDFRDVAVWQFPPSFPLSMYSGRGRGEGSSIFTAR